MGNDTESLAHTKWRYQYHVVFAPKYRRKAIYGVYRAETGKILRTICSRYRVEIIEANACIDHVHMLISIPPKMSVSKFMGILKGKMIFDRSAQMKYKYGNRHFRARGYYVDTAGRNKAALEEDKIMDQMSLKEYIDPFTGKPAEGSK